MDAAFASDEWASDEWAGEDRSDKDLADVMCHNGGVLKARPVEDRGGSQKRFARHRRTGPLADGARADG